MGHNASTCRKKNASFVAHQYGLYFPGKDGGFIPAGNLDIGPVVRDGDGDDEGDGNDGRNGDDDSGEDDSYAADTDVAEVDVAADVAAFQSGPAQGWFGAKHTMNTNYA
jgi:hypothetical protein